MTKRDSDYRLEIHVPKVERKSKRVRLRVNMYDPENTDGWAPAPPEYLVEEMAKWCKENHCGKRTSYDMFEFPNEEAAMLFRLRWS